MSALSRQTAPTSRLISFLAAIVAVFIGGQVLAQEAPSSPATAPAQAGAPAPSAPSDAEGASRFNWPSAWSADVNATGQKPKATDSGPGSAVPQPAAAARTAENIENKSVPPENARPPESSQPPAAATTEGAGQPPSAAAASPNPGGVSPPTRSAPPGSTAPPPAAGEQVQSPSAPAAPDASESLATKPADKPEVAPPPAQLNPAVVKDVEAAKSLAGQLESVEKTVERLRDRDVDLTQQLPIIESIMSKATATASRLQPALSDVKSLIDKLGPAPAEGKTEADEIAAERKRLNATSAEIDGAIKTAELTMARGRQLIVRVQELRLKGFQRSLSRRSPSILSPTLWSEAARAIPEAGRQLSTISKQWMGRADKSLTFVLMISGLSLFAGILLHTLSRRLRRWIRVRALDDDYPPSRRALFAGINAPLRMLPTIVAVAIFYIALSYEGLLYLQIGDLAIAGFKAIVVAVSGAALAASYLQPSRPKWRVIDLGDPASRQIYRLIQAGGYIFALDIFIRSLIGSLYLPLSVNIVWTSIAALLFAVVFIQVIRTNIVVSGAQSAGYAFLAGRMHKFPLAVIAVTILLSLVTGYVALAHFIATRLLIVGAAVFLLVILYLANRAIASEAEENREKLAKADLFMPLEIRKRVGRGISILLDICLFLLAGPFLLLAVGFAPTEISTFINRALFGFEIGGVEISLAKIGLALGLFAGIVFLSRMAQRWLGETILHPSRTEQGLGNSIRTGVGYLGFIFAALVGLSYAGLDITNLAIVAGALSVGIGFGLQSIVNNFVSGLILLVERPINVGDWIKVGTLEGRVRKISVRSTELETFERASVIIPNSELISGTVTNLTLRNALGRITIRVGVSYDSDAGLIEKLLLESAEECDLVARYPAPFVVFEDFGASSLDFSLRIFVTDVSSSLSTQTAVRKSIMSKFRAAGVEIPFPQQDLHLRDLDALKSGVGRAMAERAAAVAKDFAAKNNSREEGSS